MKGIEAILREHLPEAERDKTEAILREFHQNYKAVEDYNRLREKITRLERQVDELSNAATNDYEAERDELLSRLAEYQRQDEAEAERASYELFERSFDEAVGNMAAGERKGRFEFANPLVANAVFHACHDACAADASLSVEAALSMVTRNMDGVWANPQRDPRFMPANDLKGNAGETSTRRRFLNQFFGQHAQ